MSITNPFTLNLLYTLIWVALTGKTEISNFLFGFLISFGIMYLVNPNEKTGGYFRRVPNVIGFILFFIIELVKANIQVAFDVLTRKDHMKPGIVGIPLDAETDLEITLLANFVSLTPGTLSLDISTDRKTLYVHGMYIEDVESFIINVKMGFERRLLNILR